jgi:hypothetical protein
MMNKHSLSALWAERDPHPSLPRERGRVRKGERGEGIAKSRDHG